jgi:hypothetical protein
MFNMVGHTFAQRTLVNTVTIVKAQVLLKAGLVFLRVLEIFL